MTLLADSNKWAYDMLVSGFVLGTVIFALFLWQAIQNYLSVKQIRKFKDKTENYYQDKYAWAVIRSIELSIVILYAAELALFIAAEVLHTNDDDANQNVAIAHNVVFLVNAVMIISYMAIAYLWNASIIVVVNQDNLITSTSIAPKANVTVSRVLKAPHVFKITYKDPELKGNLKEVKLRYSKKMNLFLSRNGFYKGDSND